jgi:hypothetical protein
MKSINDTMLRKLAPAEAGFRVFDSATPGLHLEILPNGLKKWRLRRLHDGRRRQATLGTFPDLGLAEARRLAAADPFGLGAPTFGDLARAWLASLGDGGVLPGQAMAADLIDGTIRPALGDLEAARVSGADILERIVRPLQKSGGQEAAERARILCGRIFGFGLAAGLLRSDPLAGEPEFELPDTTGRAAPNNDPLLWAAAGPPAGHLIGSRPLHYAVKRNPRLVGLAYDPSLPSSRPVSRG